MAKTRSIWSQCILKSVHKTNTVLKTCNLFLCVYVYAHTKWEYKGLLNTFTENLSCWMSHMEMVYDFFYPQRVSQVHKKL